MVQYDYRYFNEILQLLEPKENTFYFRNNLAVNKDGDGKYWKSWIFREMYFTKNIF